MDGKPIAQAYRNHVRLSSRVSGSPATLVMPKLRARCFAVSAYFQRIYQINVYFRGNFSLHAMGLKFLKMGLPFRTNRIGIKISKVPLFVISA